MIRTALLALAVAAGTPAFAQTSEPIDNPEVAAMFASDQAERQGEIDWIEVSRKDAERRARTRALLDAGQIRTANDFYGAAFIFQHGGEPESYLLAHALAVRALALGHDKAEWIAAATLDRYLQSIARDQIYGTQYSMSPSEPASQGRYDPDFLPDSIRTASGVEELAEQKTKVEAMEKRRLSQWPAEAD